MLRLALILCPTIAYTDPPDITGVDASNNGNAWRFSVTLLHGDTGWDDYVDGWRVEAEDGSELGYRELLHPHVNEQPFTRSQSGIVIPDGTKRVFIRARDNLGGWAETRLPFDLPDGS